MYDMVYKKTISTIRIVETNNNQKTRTLKVERLIKLIFEERAN